MIITIEAWSVIVHIKDIKIPDAAIVAQNILKSIWILMRSLSPETS